MLLTIMSIKNLQARKYQDDLDADIQRAWAAGARNVLAVLPTGGGKTFLFTGVLARETGVTCAIAHRKELVSQISLALNKRRVQHFVIAPTNTIKWIVSLHAQEHGESYYNPSARCAVAGVDTIMARADKMAEWCNQVSLWVLDECFPAGTLVDGRPIETLRAGEYVRAFNEATGAFELKKITHVFKNPAPKHMVRICFKGHHVLYSTYNHPVLTKRGWVSAFRLTINDEVLYYGSNFMHGVPQASGHDKKPSMRTVPRYWKGVLLKRVFNCIQAESIFRNHGSDEQEVRFRTNENEKSHAKKRDTRESIGRSEKNEPSSKCTRRKRESRTTGGASINASLFRARFRGTTGDKNGYATGYWISSLLQGGCWKYVFKNSHRSRWKKPRFAGKASARQEERRFSRWTRLESVSFHEYGDIREPGAYIPDGYVYNIEVNSHHTYIANGVVVHNCHHVTSSNKWGKVSQMFVNARGLLVTATPERSDGKGLGRHADGIVDAMVVGPSARELITAGYLTDYRVFAPLSNIDLTGVEVGSTGDYNQKQLVSKVRQSRIVGDVVGSYLKFAAGKLGITFATDVQTAEEITAAYVAAGVPAEMVSANTPDAIRANATAKLRRGDLKQLVNVDIFGEGFDLPAIEVVSFARPTESYVLYCQQFGRGLRPMPGKTHALIIDHVGNILRHGLPDAPRAWSLDARERRSATKKELPLRICAGCTGVYERFYKVCPYCGYTHVPAGRSKPEFVDGDLTEMDPAVLEQMRAQVARLDAPFDKSKMRYAGAPEIAIAGAAKQHRLRQEAQTALRDAIAMWGGTQRHHGRPDYESYRRFYYQFGIDVLSAQALGRPEATELTERVRRDL